MATKTPPRVRASDLRTSRQARGQQRAAQDFATDEDEDEHRAAASVAPRWAAPVSMVICALAVADSAYLTYAHFTSATILICPTKGFIDCGLVTQSSYSHPFGIPVAVAGLVWSVAMLALCTPWAWQAASPWVSRARIAGSAVGVLTVFYLLWAELIKLHHICEYCTGVHILTIVLFFVVMFATALSVPAGPEESPTDEAA